MAWKGSVLVVANQTAESPDLLAALHARAAREEVAFTLVVPARGPMPEDRDLAARTLDEALTRIRDAGLEIKGSVGVSDPVAAVQEIWSPAEFDEVLVSTLPTDTSKWLRINLPHRIERLTGAQVTHVVASPRREPIVATPAPEPERHGILAPLSVLLSGGRAGERSRSPDR
ncbi:MAG: hypothetical protein E6G56_05440 [Actinobacteria bacterium]|nr:MAG: hypothetical protein E6G56_05440 [Actinomycetota bacterium]